MKKIPEKLEEVPSAYLKTANHQGKVETFSYQTYDAFSYSSKKNTLIKKALISHNSARRLHPSGKR